VPIAVAAAVAAFRYVSESRASANHGYDLPGAATVTGGLLALVYGFTKAGTDGWSASITITLFSVAAVLLVGFVAIEQRATHPLLPLRVVLDRNRGGSFLASLLVGTAILGTFLSLTYYFQGVLHYSALKTGFAFVPFSLGIITGASAASRLLPRFGPRALLTAGLLMAVAGLALFSTLDVHSTYVGTVLPAEIIVSLGMGLSFVAMNSTALIGVSPEDAGVASALVNATQQTGGTMGAALINTIATSATVSYVATHGPSAASLTAGAIHGYTTAYSAPSCWQWRPRLLSPSSGEPARQPTKRQPKRPARRSPSPPCEAAGQISAGWTWLPEGQLLPGDAGPVVGDVRPDPGLGLVVREGEDELTGEDRSALLLH
jgi:predicted MFS family arabinose efflux permease